ncbi:MAG: hypothetical protein NTX45_18090 [Proteobacteria bacterium]|nr:hypothetical protein [Pseudomonadota bacterium]
MHTVTKYLTALLAATALLAGSALAVSVPILTTPATENVGAGMATLILQYNAAGSGYFTLLAGTDALCGSGTQVKAGLDSSGAKALYRGSMTLTANTQSKYAVRNLTQSTAYTVCFTADSPSGSNLNENPLSVNLSTTAMTSIANPGWAAVGTAGFTSSQIISAALSFAPDGSPYFGYVNFGGIPFVSKYAQPIWSISPGAGASIPLVPWSWLLPQTGCLM